MADVDDLHAIAHGTIDDDVASSRSQEAPVFSTELRPANAYAGLVGKQLTHLLEPIHEPNGAARAVLGDVVVDLLKV